MFTATSMFVWGIMGGIVLGSGKKQEQPITTIKFKDFHKV